MVPTNIRTFSSTDEIDAMIDSFPKGLRSQAIRLAIKQFYVDFAEYITDNADTGGDVEENGVASTSPPDTANEEGG
jgi:hypothetical protein